MYLTSGSGPSAACALTGVAGTGVSLSVKGADPSHARPVSSAS